MKSRFNSTCIYCRHEIARGDDILKGPRGYGHTRCVEAPTSEAVTLPRPAADFVPSKYQTAVFEFIQHGNGHAVVEAVAGSGKTTTLVKALEFTPATDSVAFVAFNRHIAAELQQRAPSHVRVSTLHSLGLTNIRKALGRVKVDDQKVDRILDSLPDFEFPEDADRAERSKIFVLRGATKKAIALVKATLIDASNTTAVESLCERYGVELNDNTETILHNLPQIIARCAEETRLVDFDDMCWLPIYLNLPVEKFDWLFVDESQDLNACQIKLVLASVKPTGRVIAVGDAFQSIYGFRGAAADAIPNLVAALDATRLPLSITYRCPQCHVKLAQEFVPHIEARPNAPDGVIEYVQEHELSPQSGDLVLCRINAPLVPLAFALIRKGVKAVVRGRDIGKILADFTRKLGGETIEEFLAALTDYQERETRRLLARRSSATQIDALEDRCNTLAAVASECSLASEVADRIEALFSDDIAGVVLSSIHRAKGLEADHVYILRPDLLPFAKAKQDWEIQQERNVTYVAYTRSRAALFFVEETL